MTTATPSYRTVYELLRGRHGANAEIRIGDVSSVGTTAIPLVQANPSRAVLLAANLHATQYIYVLPMRLPTTSTGIPLPPGGYMLWEAPDDLIMPALDWYAVANGANTNCVVIEGVLR